MTKQKKEVRTTVTINLPVTEHPEGIGGLHHEVCTADSEVGEVVVSCGYGLGNPQIYVSVGGKRVLAADTTPMLKALVLRAIDLATDEQRQKVK